MSGRSLYYFLDYSKVFKAIIISENMATKKDTKMYSRLRTMSNEEIIRESIKHYKKAINQWRVGIKGSQIALNVSDDDKKELLKKAFFVQDKLSIEELRTKLLTMTPSEEFNIMKRGLFDAVLKMTNDFHKANDMPLLE